MLIEIHMLKNFAPTNLNRDDSGAPKSCIFGGVQRSRISSQCLKHSWRVSEYFQNQIGKENFGIRTRKLPELIADDLRKSGIDDDVIGLVTKKLTGIGTKDGKEQKDTQTGSIIFYSSEDITAISDWIKSFLSECNGDKKKIEKLSVKTLQEKLKKNNKRSISLDMALFGRMVTSDAFADVEASMQVAHAISTNRVSMESDFFTAVDDMLDRENGDTGSAMMGDIDFNSSCYYIYAALDTGKLAENLGDHVDAEYIRKIVKTIIATMAYTNPSGKQNSFAGHSLPSAVLVETKDVKVPTSYANAFVKSVAAGSDGLITNSMKALISECETITKGYAIPTIQRLWYATNPDVKLDDTMGTNCESFVNMLEKLDC